MLKATSARFASRSIGFADGRRRVRVTPGFLAYTTGKVEIEWQRQKLEREQV